MNKTDQAYVIGIDFGTDSCRTLLVNAITGEELTSVVAYYPRWKKGLYCNPSVNQYRQHPLDYIESLESAIKKTVDLFPVEVTSQIKGIAIDTTGSTPVLTDRNGMPLALLPEFAENPNAMFVLWKDHTATGEAEEINRLAKKWDTDYTVYSGGVYSSEWVWSKMLHMLRIDSSVREVAYSWIEHCDWMPALLTGNNSSEKIRRSRCAAGHKAMWNEHWGGLPSVDFLTALDPLLGVFEGHLYSETYTSDTCAGYVTEEWSKRLGLHGQIAVAVGALDCHFGAVGAEIKEKTFVRVMGTSTCDVMVVSYNRIGDTQIKGICGQVDGSVLPGMAGLEAGQSAFGDVYAWFKELLFRPISELLTLLDAAENEELIKRIDEKLLPYLTREAEKIPLSENQPIALDWLNGRRTPNANQLVKGVISELTLGTTAPLLFKSLVEATAFGSKAIVDCFLEQGVDIDRVIAIGGISQKSPYVMQTLTDVLNMPIQVAQTEQACALGAAMFAAVAAGIHPTVELAQKAMGKGFSKEYVPDPDKHKQYMALYEKYLRLGRFAENKC